MPWKVKKNERATYLGIVLERRKSHDIPVTVHGRNCKVSRFNQLEDFWVRVDPVVDVVFADLDQIDDRVAVIRVRTA